MEDAIDRRRKDEYIECGKCRLLHGQGGELHIAQGCAADDQGDDREEEVEAFFRFHRSGCGVEVGFRSSPRILLNFKE